MRIMVQMHNWAIFLRKSARRGRYSQWRSLSGHDERIFVHKILRGGYWQHLVSTERRYVPQSQNYTRFFEPCFWRSHYQPQSWGRLANPEMRFNTHLWGAVKDKCYADIDHYHLSVRIIDRPSFSQVFTTKYSTFMKNTQVSYYANNFCF